MKTGTWIAIGVAALLLLMSAVFVVREGQTAMVLNLGRVVRSDIGPGLHFKAPLIESVRIFDRRLQVLDAAPERYLTSERKDVSVDFFAVGQIENAQAFYRATGGDEEVAAQRLAPIIKDSLRNEINARTLSQVVSGNRSEVIGPQLEGINRGAATMGVRIVDLRIKQIDLPTDSKVIKFVNLPADAVIRIYSSSGVLVALLEHHSDQNGGALDWDVRNRNAQFVASGVYFYHVESGDATRIGKMTIVNFAQ